MIKNIEKIDEIHVDARRWFHNSMGNTYHTVRVEVFAGGEWIEMVSDMTYGGDDHYMHTAAMTLLENGFSNSQLEGIRELDSNQSIDKQSYQLAHDLRMCPNVSNAVSDVLKRDLHKK